MTLGALTLSHNCAVVFFRLVQITRVRDRKHGQTLLVRPASPLNGFLPLVVRSLRSINSNRSKTEQYPSRWLSDLQDPGALLAAVDMVAAPALNPWAGAGSRFGC